FNAQGFLVKGKKKSTYSDITNAPGTVWTSNNNPPGGPLILQPPTTSNGGQYTGLIPGCACINVSSGGIVAEPVSVAVLNSSTTTPTPTPVVCPEFCPTRTASPTATSTPKSSSSATSEAANDSESSSGTVLWTFDAQSPVAGPIICGADGSANFVTGGGM